MQISKILHRDRIFCNSPIFSKKTALEYIAKLLEKGNDGLLNYTDILDSLINREKLGSTGFGNGVAIPHNRITKNKQPIAAFLKLKTGIDFDAIDGAPVDLIFALLVPENSTDEHLNILANLVEILSRNDTIKRLRSSTTSDEIYQILTG